MISVLVNFFFGSRCRSTRRSKISDAMKQNTFCQIRLRFFDEAKIPFKNKSPEIAFTLKVILIGKQMIRIERLKSEKKNKTRNSPINRWWMSLLHWRFLPYSLINKKNRPPPKSKHSMSTQSNRVNTRESKKSKFIVLDICFFLSLPNGEEEEMKQKQALFTYQFKGKTTFFLYLFSEI